MLDSEKLRSKPQRWWRWARQHPTAILFGALVLGVLIAPHPWSKNAPMADLDADETPLFI